MSEFAEHLQPGTRIRYRTPPSVVPPTGWGGPSSFVAPGAQGVVTYVAGAPSLTIASVRFEYYDAGGRVVVSTPIRVVPGQPCEVV